MPWASGGADDQLGQAWGMADLSTYPIEVIARLPSELVPEDRLEELADYRAALRRPPQKSEEQLAHGGYTLEMA